ncbi:peptidase [Apiospora arundinis]|uniref:Pyroglutamyl-peptidase 1 n=1 Tax=Apiospora arundinis TaxID=335852 RepID=A0ABR2J966_9PEZI
MGSVGVPKDDEFTILVTGFGPFKDQYPINPSWEIARSLPEYLPADRVKDPAHQTSDTPLLSPRRRVRILVHPAPVRVNYEVVRGLVPSLWDDDDDPEGCGGRVDAVLHIGMAGPQRVYQVERRAHRDGYLIKDVDGLLLDDERRRREAGGDEGWIWEGLPTELLSDLNVDDIHKRWVEHCPKGLDLRISEDPGRYLCDFIYYSSMAHLTKQSRPRKVVFLHVPCDQSQEVIKSGVEIATQLIRSIAESEMASKKPAEAEQEAHVK